MKRQDIKKRPLSDTTLAGLSPEAAIYREPDGNGLYFKVKPNGHKSWELRHKRPDGKWSWLGLGPYPALSGALARRKVIELHVQLATGDNPFVSRRERKAQAQQLAKSTFENLAREWHAAREYGWDPGTARRILGALEKHLFPVFGKRPYTSILPMEWMEFFRTLQQTGIVEQSSRVRRYCAEIYDLARVTGRAVHNPVEGLRKFLLTSKKSNYAHVSTDELPLLLRSIRTYPHAPDVRLGLRLLCLLAVRPSELREAQWSEFHFDKKLWIIPAARMKKRREHSVPLSRQALEALKDLRPLTGAYPLLFPGRNDHTQPRSETVFRGLDP